MSDKPSYEELERLYAESRARNEELYRALFEEVYSPMLVINPTDGDIIDANIAACEYYGYDKQEIKQTKITDINTLSEEQVLEEMCSAEEQKRHYFNFRHKKKNGDIGDVEIYSGPITLNEKIVLCSIVHDITERKEIENQILHEKNFSVSLIQALPGIMYLFDEFGSLHRWNKNFETVTGYSDQEIRTMNPLDFVVTDDRLKLKKAIDGVFLGGEANVEASLLTKSGSMISCFLTGYRFDSGDVKYLVGVGIDISERKESEAEKENLIRKLQFTLGQVKQLSGFLPICSSCKKIRDDEGYWSQIESYIRDHSEAEFSHGICPECLNKLYSDYNKP